MTINPSVNFKEQSLKIYWLKRSKVSLHSALSASHGWTKLIVAHNINQFRR